MKKININDKNCELCKEPASNIYCECCLYLCDSYFSLLHGKKENLFHKKEKIAPFIFIDIKCPEHPTIPMNLFYFKEKSNIYIIYIII